MITRELLELTGYYVVNSQTYATKQSAIAAAGWANIHRIKYFYNPTIYSAYDWTKEPEPHLSIDEFYRRRAQHLRDKYDYLILMYSGGPDSQNVLDTFVDNNIFLDEIINFNSFSETGVVDKTMNNADYVYNVKPTLERLQATKNLKSRITILSEIETVSNYFDYCRQLDLPELVVETGGPSISAYRPYTLKYIPHIWKMIISGKKVGMIHGSEKPLLVVKDGKFGLKFTDGVFGEYGFLSQQDSDLKNFNSWEMFYTSADTATLQIKQAHVLKKFMESNDPTEIFCRREETYYTSQTTGIAPKGAYECHGKIPDKYLKYSYYHKTIYPKFDTARFVTQKHQAGLMKPDLFWLHKTNESKFNFGIDSLKQWMKQQSPALKKDLVKGAPIFYTDVKFIE